MSTRLFFLLLLMLGAETVFAQFKLNGIIKEGEEKNISYATIQVLDKTTQKTLAYTLSEADGSFEIEMDQTGSFILEVNHIGYKIHQREFEIISSKLNYNFDIQLLENVEELKEVVVQASPSLARQNGDTIAYRVEAFTTGNEEKLKDVLNKLPGIEVDENGKIKANGKKVDKLLLDGEEFFGDNHKLATDNLSAEMIAGVDLYKNYESFSAIKDFEKSGKTALNIGIKEAYKGKVTGDISGLYAHEERYKAHSNLFRFDKKVNISLIANANNLGDRPLSLQDYMSLNAGIKRDTRNNTPTSNLSTDDLPLFLLSDDHLQSINSEFVALNLSYTLSAKSKISAYSLLNTVRQTETIFAEKSYFTGTETLTALDSIRTANRFFFNQSKVSFEYKANENSLLNYSAFLEMKQNRQDRDILSRFVSNRSSFLEKTDSRPFTFGQQLSYLRKIASNKLITINLYQEIKNIDDDYDLNATVNLLNFGTNSILQQTQRRTHEYALLGKYTQKISTHILNLGLSYINRRENSESEIEELADRSNSLTIDRCFWDMELALSKKEGSFQYVLSNKFRVYNGLSEQTNAQEFYFLPKLELKYAFKPTQDITMYYNRNVTYPRAIRFFEQDYLRDYRTVFSDSELRLDSDVIGDVFGLRFFSFDLFSGTLVYLNSSYTIEETFITTNTFNSIDFNTIQYRTSPDRKKWDNILVFETRIKKLQSRIKLSGNYSLVNSYNYLSNELNAIQTKITSVRLTMLSKFKQDYLNYRAGLNFRKINTDYSINDLGNNFLSYNPFLILEGQLKNNFSYRLSNAYEYFDSEELNRGFWNLGFKIAYKTKSKKYEFEIRGDNLLNLDNAEIVETLSDGNLIERSVRSRLTGFIGVGLTLNL